MMFGVIEYVFDGEAPTVTISAEDRLKAMVASLPQEDLYAIDFKIVGSSAPSMLYLPREGDGKWIVSFNGMHLTLPARDLSWNADVFEFNMTLRFGEMGGDFDVEGSIERSGEIAGSIAAEDGSPSFLPSAFEGSRLTGSD